MNCKQLLVGLLLLPVGAWAQITIQGSSLNSWMPPDTVADVSNASAAATTNGMWDLSSATYAPGTFITTDVATTSTTFPSATYKRTISYTLNGTLGYGAELYWSKDNSGFYEYGEKIARQAYSLASVTGSNMDSLVFPAQDVIYSAPGKDRMYPMTNGTHWSSSYDAVTHLNLTVTMASMNNTPGERRTHKETRDTVKGWGQMRITDGNGMTSGYMNVLAVQHREYVRDSFYLGGAPASPTLLSAFGVTQGQVTTRFQNLFIRDGEMTALLDLTFSDSTFTAVTDGQVSRTRLAAGTNSVSAVQPRFEYNAYPNPVTNGTLHISGLSQNHTWTYSMTALNGQTLKTGTLTAGKAELNLSELTPGVYTLTVFKNGSAQGGEFIIVR